MQRGYLYGSMTVKWMWLKVISQCGTHIILDVYTCDCVKSMCYEITDDRRQPDVGQGHL